MDPDRHLLTGNLTVVVISLPRRADRLAAFHQRWRAATAPFGGLRYTVHPAVDTGDAAGCLASHLGALARYPGPLLVLEDDACFAPGFTPFLVPPGDWWVLWLGGQHRLPPLPVDRKWVRPRYLVRTHGYLVRHPADLAAWMYVANPPRIDPYIAALPFPQYALKTFTVGQTAGVSDIGGAVRIVDEYWNWPVTGRGRSSGNSRGVAHNSRS